MSHFSDIGFQVRTEQDLQQMVENASKHARRVPASTGSYAVYSDKSGAELWVQLERRNIIIGVNPHFAGKSRRTVCLTERLEGKGSKMDGSFYAWADPAEENNPESGAYPFVFDVPDFRTIGEIEMPHTVQIQLAAFAHELTYYESEEEYDASQKEEPRFAVQSFIPAGLFSSGEGEEESPGALGVFTGTIVECEKRKNHLTGHTFHWLLVETLGGEVDVVVYPDLLDREPQINGVVQGHFWLSGRLVNRPAYEPPKKGLFSRLFKN